MQRWHSAAVPGRDRRRRWLAGGIALAALTLVPATGATAAPKKPDFPKHVIGQEERQETKAAGIGNAVASADPISAETLKGNERALEKQRRAGPPEGPEGPIQQIEGALPTRAAAASAAKRSGSKRAVARAAVGEAPTWPISFAANPNRQVGKLYFDVAPGPAVDYRWCSATAVNSENKSTVLTAGHCVFSPDPDGNGLVSGNGYWHENVFFCPGYEFGCKLGVYYPRLMTTTWSWFQGTGNPRVYDWSDDVAALVVNPNANGLLVNFTGGQGITWNAPTNLFRWAYGYPASDWRWPAYTYSGEDMIYCPGTSWAATGSHLALSCTMTGGSSGGPWLTYVGSNWLGYVNGVNSHKPWGGPLMGSPYFGNAEGDLYNWVRAA
jgi:hypothetical protein